MILLRTGHRTAKIQITGAIVQVKIKGHRVLGLSSAIIGSGMAFRYNYSGAYVNCNCCRWF
jgi:hypothetical protein